MSIFSSKSGSAEPAGVNSKFFNEYVRLGGRSEGHKFFTFRASDGTEEVIRVFTSGYRTMDSGESTFSMKIDMFFRGDSIEHRISIWESSYNDRDECPYFYIPDFVEVDWTDYMFDTYIKERGENYYNAFRNMDINRLWWCKLNCSEGAMTIDAVDIIRTFSDYGRCCVMFRTCRVTDGAKKWSSPSVLGYEEFKSRYTDRAPEYVYPPFEIPDRNGK